MLAATLFSSASLAQTAGKLPPINVKEYTLKNGLRVITHRRPLDPGRERRHVVPRRVKE